MGVFAAIPIKRQLVNIEQLPFPTGTATAETLQALHGQDEASRGKARFLGIAGLVGALIAFCAGREGLVAARGTCPPS